MNFVKYVLCILLAGFLSCEKDKSPQNLNAEIIGVDLRLCACCGGWWMKVDGDSARALYFPGDFGDSVNVNELHMKVIMTWDKVGVPNCLNENIIHVLTIRKK
jgi:hypothetical protein